MQHATENKKIQIYIFGNQLADEINWIYERVHDGANFGIIVNYGLQIVKGSPILADTMRKFKKLKDFLKIISVRNIIKFD